MAGLITTKGENVDTRERIEEYGMIMPVEEQVGLRERLSATAPVIAGRVHEEPRQWAPVQIRKPGGEWYEL